MAGVSDTIFWGAEGMTTVLPSSSVRVIGKAAAVGAAVGVGVGAGVGAGVAGGCGGRHGGRDRRRRGGNDRGCRRGSGGGRCAAAVGTADGEAPALVHAPATRARTSSTAAGQPLGRANQRLPATGNKYPSLRLEGGVGMNRMGGAYPFSRRYEQHRKVGDRTSATFENGAVTVAGLCRNCTGFATRRRSIDCRIERSTLRRRPAAAPDTWQ